jgi:hypothetical protein
LEDEFDLKNTEWTGDWQINIRSDKAEGSYNVKINTAN